MKLLPVSDDGRPPYWNFTSNFDFDLQCMCSYPHVILHLKRRPRRAPGLPAAASSSRSRSRNRQRATVVPPPALRRRSKSRTRHHQPGRGRVRGAGVPRQVGYPRRPLPPPMRKRAKPYPVSCPGAPWANPWPRVSSSQSMSLKSPATELLASQGVTGLKSLIVIIVTYN